MNKLPTKQIYLLVVIIVGIIALSVYSTYALFTFESSTSNVVNIHIAKSLTIQEDVYEYQQVTIPSKGVSTTDVDIYNDLDYDVCYSIWYKFVDKELDNEKVKIFQISDNTITSSGVMEPMNKIRVKIGIINDLDKDVKINLGTSASKSETGSCSLNLSNDKKIIDTSYERMNNFSEELLGNKDNVDSIDGGYLTYKNISDELVYKLNDKVYISNKFNYKDEIFELDSNFFALDDVLNDDGIQNDDLYLCMNDYKCKVLYKISDIVKIENDVEIDKDNIDEYKVILSDKMVGYLGGNNGLRKINQDYIYYGDNPNNYVYFNCDNDINSCELWRIVGIFYNNDNKKYSVKLVSHNSIGKYSFDKDNNDNFSWINSSLNKYLNNDFEFRNGFDNYIDSFNDKLEIVTLEDNVIKKIDDVDEYKVGIINLSEYMYASLCDVKSKVIDYDSYCYNNNWLNSVEIDSFWTRTISEIKDVDNDGLELVLDNNAYAVGDNVLFFDAGYDLDVRPSVYLKDRIVVVAGDGSFEKPYIIK